MKKGRQNFRGTRAVEGLAPAIAPGQPLTQEQLGATAPDPYSGGYSGKILPQTTNTLFTQSVGSLTTLGTLSTSSLTSANIRTSTNRSNLPTAATAGSIVGVRCSSKGLIWRGNAAGLGGFRFRQKIAASQFTAGMRMQSGLTNSLAAPTNVDPLFSTPISKIALAVNAEGGNYKLIHNLAGTAPTVIDLAGHVFDNISIINLELTALPNDSVINYKVWKDNGGAIAQGTLSSNIPPNDAFLAPSFWITNNTTAAICSLDFVGWWLDSKNG